MKKIMCIFLSVLICSYLSIAEPEKDGRLDVLPDKYSETSIKVLVEGMVCSFCAQGISASLKREPAVKDVEISMSDRTVVIYLKKDQDLETKKIKTLIEESGYEIENIEKNNKK